MAATYRDPAERSYLRFFYRDWRPTRLGKFMTGVLAWLSGLGILPPVLVTLQVRGRRSGRLHSKILVVAEHEGQRYLVSMLGNNSEWVRNVRAAGGEAFIKRGRARLVRLTEIPTAERGPILKAYCQVATSGREHFPVSYTAPVAEFEALAERYPVFRIDPEPTMGKSNASDIELNLLQRAKRTVSLLIWFGFALLVVLPSILWAYVAMMPVIHYIEDPISSLRFWTRDRPPILDWASLIVGGIVLAILPLVVCWIAIRRKAVAHLTAVPIFGILTIIVLGHVYKTKMSVPSPDSQYQVELRQPVFGTGFVVRLCSPQGCKEVYDPEHHGDSSAGSSISFAKVAWCDSSESFAVLTDGALRLQFAYDVVNSRLLPFENLRQCMEQAIRLEYSLPVTVLDRNGRPLVDREGRSLGAIDWARHREGHQVFFWKHPEW